MNKIKEVELVRSDPIRFKGLQLTTSKISLFREKIYQYANNKFSSHI